MPVGRSTESTVETTIESTMTITTITQSSLCINGLNQLFASSEGFSNGVFNLDLGLFFLLILLFDDVRHGGNISASIESWVSIATIAMAISTIAGITTITGIT